MRDRLIELLKNAPRNARVFYDQEADYLLENGVIVPPCETIADVAEVKHGKWKRSGNEKKCSACDFIYYSNNDEWNYCPDCGSKMDGKEDA